MPKYCQSLDDFERLKKEYETDNQEKQELRKRYIQAEEAYQDMQPPSINPNWALFWLVLIAIAEFPLNSIVFEIFGQERIETYIMSGIICVGIPLMAHFLGKAGRKEIKSGTDKAILIICPLIVLSMLVAIAIIRMLYFKEMTTKINASPETMTIIFVIINIFIFVVATIISYNAAHPKPEEFKAKRKKYLQIKKQIRRDDKEGIVLVKRIEKCSFT
ncbi:MAG: hypothetical protein FJY10_08485, partial [Bacteroidetes bacterium]|nr:hypothetical protein [Bacteroidota bacterium]